MSLQVLMHPSLLMGKHCHQSPDHPQPRPNKASPQSSSRPTSTTSSMLAKAFRGREGKSPQPAPSPAASENPTSSTPIQPLARDPPRPARPAGRVPAVTSKAMTTAPVKDKSRPHRRKYPTNMRQRH